MGFSLAILPLSEQHRIVDKIDQLEASICDRNDTAIHYAEAIVQQKAATSL